jgi:DNA-binding GntR family transcriptional regulator
MARYMTMTEMALESLRKSILKGELPPGTQLVPAKLESELSLSREAIRDAIRQIVGYGLAETITNKGSYVALPITLEELKEVFELRLQVEPKIATKALQNITSQQLNALEELCSNMETIYQQKESFPDHFIWNREFHLSLYRPADWNYLHRCIGQWLDQILIFRSCLCKTEMHRDLDKFNQEHQQIIKTIRAKDSEALRDMVENNVRSGLENIINNYSEDLMNQYVVKQADS